MALFFGKKPQPPPPVTEIGEKTEIEGEVTSKREIRIRGKITGFVKSDEKVELAKGGVLKGTIASSAARIEGSVTGTANVSQLMELGENAVFEGELFSKKLKIVKGACLKGKISS